MIEEDSIIKQDLDGQWIYEDKRTRFFDEMIGLTKYNIFILKTGNLDRAIEELGKTEKEKERYIQEKWRELKKRG